MQRMELSMASDGYQEMAGSGSSSAFSVAALSPLICTLGHRLPSRPA